MLGDPRWSARREALLAALSSLERFLVYGPDPVDPDESPGPLETLLPWPVRLLLTAGTWLIARIWYDSGPARQLAWALAYAGGIAVSLATSFWWIIFIANGLLGAAWLALTFLPPPDPRRHPVVWAVQHGVEFANRQLSHIEAFWIWMAVLLAWKPRINYQLPALVALLLLGPALINWLAARQHPEARKAAGDLQAVRRPFIYGATLLGLGIIVMRSLDGQILHLLPLAYAIALGAILRWARHRQRSKQVSARDPHNPDPNVRAFRRAQRRATRRADVGLGPVLAVASLLALVGLSVVGRRDLDQRQRGALDGPVPPADSCVPEQGGPARPEVTMFLAADSHSHELGGQRFAGQTELADALANSALRPVEQDMLSVVPVARFGRAFADMVRDRAAAGGGPIFWAHLGDMSDLSCTGELERAFKSFSAFPADRLAGVASGNHDIAFTGNFSWSPFWTPACGPSRRLDKIASIAMTRAFVQSTGIEGRGGAVAEVGTTALPRWLGGQAGALVTVTPLGPVQHRGRARGLAAIFIDSTDGRAFDWGIGGLYGSFSHAQDRQLRAMVAELPSRAGPLYGDPIWLVFAHHRVGDMAGPSRQRLNEFLVWLDRDPLGRPANGTDGWQGPPEPRTLAIITAHTHVAESHRHCVGKRVIREIVVGSVIDPPQQAAVLEVGADPKGIAAARLRTLPSVGRAGFTCGGGGGPTATIDAAECRRVVASLKAAPACEPLFQEPTLPGPECGALERDLSWDQRVRALINARGVFEPADIRDEQVARGRALLACVCRDGAPGAGGSASCRSVGAGADPFDGAAYADIMAERLRSGGEPAEKELACLSWAAAAVEGHKASGMTFTTALRCAFDDSSLPAAQESVASLEVHPCR